MTDFSIIIPIYNEERLLRAQVKNLICAIEKLKITSKYEIILVENGSTDKTGRIAKSLTKSYQKVKMVTVSEPSYGMAFKEGLYRASYPLTFQFDLDFWDMDFLQMALTLSPKYDIIIGSKNLSYSHDNRPLSRRFMSKLIEIVIQARFRVRITDTHGLKAIKKDKILPLLPEVICSKHFFDSELLLRAYIKGLTFKELPVDLSEIRKSRFPFLLRFREVASECLQLLFVSLREEKPVKTFKYPLSYDTA